MRPADLGRLGAEVQRLFGWPPSGPNQVRSLLVTAGEGLAAGRAEADALVDSGVDLLVLEGSGRPDRGLAVVAVLLDLEPVQAVGTAGGPGWAAQVVAVRELARQLRPGAQDPALLVTDPVLGRLTGLLQRCGERRTPVLLGSDVLVLAAAVTAARLSTQASTWWLAGSRPTTGAGRAALGALGLEPLLDLGVQVGGAPLALGLLRGAVDLAARPPSPGAPERTAGHDSDGGHPDG